MGRNNMTRKFKALGVAFVALLAMGAVSALTAPGASAAKFKCDVQPCTVTAEKDPENPPHFVIGTGLTVSCEEEKLEGTSELAETDALTVTPTWAKCTSSVGSATVKVNHCDLKLTSETINSHGEIHIGCVGEEKIELTTGGCTVKVGPQKVTGANYKNIPASGGKPRHVTATVTSPLTYTKSGLTCGFVSGAAEFKGSYTVKCYEDKGKALSGTEATTPPATTHGNQTGCEKS
jgi:hypothetical protein